MRADRAELALADLLPILGAGAEEREVDGDVEYALYGLEAELPREDEIRALTRCRRTSASEPVPDGWERRWHEYLRPVRVGDLVVRPPWIEGAPGRPRDRPGRVLRRRHARDDADLPRAAAARAARRRDLRLGGGDRRAGDRGGAAGLGAGDGGRGRAGRARGDPGERRAQRRRGRGARGTTCATAAPWARPSSPTCRSPCCSRSPAASAGSRATRPATRIIASGMLAAEADEVVAAFGMRARRRLERGELGGGGARGDPARGARGARAGRAGARRAARARARRAGGARRRRRHRRVRALRRARRAARRRRAAGRRGRRAGRRLDERGLRRLATGATGTGRSTSGRCACGRRGRPSGRARSTW